MKDRTNRFSVVFASGISIAATITYCLMTLMALRNCFLIPKEFGVIGVIISGAMLVATTPAVLITVGMILSCISGRKNEISPGGIMCIKVGVLIISICGFIGGLAFTVMVFIGILAVNSISREMYYSYSGGNETILIYAILGLVLMISIVYTVLSLMYGIKLFSLLGKVRWYEVRKDIIKTGFLRVITVILSIVSGIGLFVSLVINTVSNSLMYYLYYYMEEITDLDYIPGSVMYNPLISNISGMCNVVFFILLTILLGKIQFIFRMSRREVVWDLTGDNNMMNSDNGQYYSKKEQFKIHNGRNGYGMSENGCQNGYQNEYQNSIYNGATTNIVKQNDFFDVNEADTLMINESSQTGRLFRNVGESGKITCMSGKDAGCCYEIKDGEELIIGLSPDAAHIIVDSSFSAVSRKHCAIRYIADTDEYFIIDYSTNGTFLNGGVKLNKNSYVAVASGTVIKLGNDELAYRLG